MGLNISIKGYVACWISNILGKDVVQKLGLETAKKQKDLSIIVKNRYVVVDSIDLHRRLRTSTLQGFISVSLSLKQIIKNQTVNSTGHSSVGRAADCRSAGHLFESGCPDLISRMQVLCKLVKFFK